MLSVDPTASQRPPLLKCLREATSRSHNALHQNEMLRPLTEDRITPTAYANLMLRFLGYYRTLDPILIAASTSHAARLSGFTYEPRSPFFEHDLRALNTDLARVPVCPRHPNIPTLAAFAGALYVVEGSSLGGSVLERAASRSLPAEACSYWRWCRENCGDRWRMTERLLVELDATETRHEATRTAQSTFETMLDWFESTPTAPPAPSD